MQQISMPTTVAQARHLWHPRTLRTAPSLAINLSSKTPSPLALLIVFRLTFVHFWDYSFLKALTCTRFHLLYSETNKGYISFVKTM